MTTTAKKPQDHKPKETAVERELDDFTWDHDGQIITLPPASKVKAGVIRRATKLDSEVAQIFAVMENLASPEALDVIDDMDLDQLGEFFLAWQEHSGSRLGES